MTGRNDELIFNWISYAFAINMLTQWVWFPTFRSVTGFGYIVSSMDIVVMLGTALYMMMVSTRFEVNGWEWTFIRAGLSIYSGWLTTATILNFTATLKFFGFSGFTWLSEELITILILYTASLIYNLAAYIELNPLYGSVFIWVLIAIRVEVLSERPQYTDLELNLDLLGIF